MAFIHHRSGRWFLLRWTGPPTVDDGERLRREARLARETVGEPLTCCALISHEASRVPDREMRERMRRGFPDLYQNLESLHIVVEGDDTHRKLMRTFFRTLAVLARIEGIQIHDSLAGIRHVYGNGLPPEFETFMSAQQTPPDALR